jgi:hypothetical protein
MWKLAILYIPQWFNILVNQLHVNHKWLDFQPTLTIYHIKIFENFEIFFFVCYYLKVHDLY